MATIDRLAVTAERLNNLRGDLYAMISPCGLLSSQHGRDTARGYLLSAELLVSMAIANIHAELGKLPGLQGALTAQDRIDADQAGVRA